MKCPLTPEAKQLAKQLVNAWSNGDINQLFYLIDTSAGHDKTLTVDFGRGLLRDDLKMELELGQFRELGTYGLIQLTTVRNNQMERFEVVLLQELRNAVENDFEVSEYFLTMNAVGTIVQGNLTMSPGSTFQSAASNTGDIAQNLEQVADDLYKIFGEDFLQEQTELRQSIDDLRDTTDANNQSKLGKVVSELGRCLNHGANAATVGNALITLAPFVQHLT